VDAMIKNKYMYRIKEVIGFDYRYYVLETKWLFWWIEVKEDDDACWDLPPSSRVVKFKTIEEARNYYLKHYQQPETRIVEDNISDELRHEMNSDVISPL
jgi:hypothetical protein